MNTKRTTLNLPTEVLPTLQALADAMHGGNVTATIAELVRAEAERRKMPAHTIGAPVEALHTIGAPKARKQRKAHTLGAEDAREGGSVHTIGANDSAEPTDTHTLGASDAHTLGAPDKPARPSIAEQVELLKARKAAREALPPALRQFSTT